MFVGGLAGGLAGPPGEPIPSFTNNVVKRLDVDRAAGRVRITYVHGGKLVVENYRISGVRVYER